MHALLNLRPCGENRKSCVMEPSKRMQAMEPVKDRYTRLHSYPKSCTIAYDRLAIVLSLLLHGVDTCNGNRTQRHAPARPEGSRKMRHSRAVVIQPCGRGEKKCSNAHAKRQNAESQEQARLALHVEFPSSHQGTDMYSSW